MTPGSWQSERTEDVGLFGTRLRRTLDRINSDSTY